MIELTYLGHAAFLVADENYRVIIDPFLTDNPRAAARAEDINVDAVLVTHGHSDHFGDTLAIAKRCKALVIGPNELVAHCIAQGTLGHPMHLGGRHKFDFGEVKLTLAFHGFSKELPGGHPCGFILKMGGKTVYHAGDTALFSDMKLIAEFDPIDVALLPIGDNFTMGADEALKAVEFLAPEYVIPMHYNTWPVIEADAQDFVKRIDSAIGIVLEPGRTRRFE